MIDGRLRPSLYTVILFNVFSSSTLADSKPEPIYFTLKCNTQLDSLKTPEIATNLLQAADFNSETDENGVVKISALGMDSFLDEIGSEKCSPYAFYEKTELIDNHLEPEYPSMPQRRDTSYGVLNYIEGQEVEYYPPIVSFSKGSRTEIAKRNWNAIKFTRSKVRKEFSCLAKGTSIKPLFSKEEAHAFLASYFVKSKFVDSVQSEVALQEGTYTHSECIILEE